MMRGYLGAILLASAGVPTVVQGQIAPAVTPAADPARLTAARDLIDILMPPATRAQMVESMMTPMLANLRQGMTQNPDFAKAMNGDPRVKALFDTFMARQQTRTTTMMRDALPGMSDAMARAYARRFDVAQMREIKAFFQTPTGRLYMQQSYTIMADPDVGAWQRTMMANSMTGVQADVADFAKQIAALEPKKK
jgi:hypothetical protein